jgi:Fe-S-cluster containining protein
MPSLHKRKTPIPFTPQEQLVRDVYGRIDAAAGRELARLRCEEGVVSSCQRGCCSCCGQHIQTNPAEAHALGQYIKRTFSVQQIDGLRRRTRQWLAWEGGRRKEDDPAGRSSGPELIGYEPCCPLLVDRACSAYPVRPVICRTHYVSSDPADCRPSHDLQPVEHAPVVLASILNATQPLAQLLRADIKSAGGDFSRSIMLLPHWLAVEMGWEFPEEE